MRDAGGAQSNIEENAFWYRGNERIYCLSTLERARLLSSALWLWKDWPRRFIETCREVGLFSHTILSYGRNPPFVLLLLDPVRESLLKPFYSLCEAEVRSAKAHLHKQGKRASLTELQALTGNKLHALRNEPLYDAPDFVLVDTDIDDLWCSSCLTKALFSHNLGAIER